MHAFDAPMAAGAAGEPFDVEGRGRDIVTGLEAAAVAVFGTGVELKQALDGLEARRARRALGGPDTIAIAGGGIEAGLDPAVALLDAAFGDELGCGSIGEIVLDVGFEGGLVALEGEQVIGLVGNDLVGDGDLAAHGVDAHERVFELLGFGELIEKIGDGGDLVGLIRHAQLRQDQPRLAGVSAQGMQSLEPFALVMGAARGLAINGDDLVPAWPERRDPAVKAAAKEDWIDSINEGAQPPFAGNSMMEFRKAP